MKRLACAVLLGVIASAAMGQAVCYRWFSNDSALGIVGTYYPSLTEAANAVISYKNANPQTGGSGSGQFTTTYTLYSCSTSPASGSSGSRTCTWTATRVPAGGGSCFGSGGTVSCGPSSQNFSISFQTDPAGCPACAHDGKKNWGVSPSGPYPVGGFCDGSCKVTPTQQSCSGPPTLQTCTALLEYASESSCAGSPKPSGATEETPSDTVEGERCMAVGDGEYCMAATGGGQCGYMNDTYICLNKVKQDECKVLGDGGRVCGAGAATTPPVPDSGTPGDLAEPDGELSNVPGGTGSSTTSYNYYNPVTVAGSSRDPGTDGAAPDGGSPSSGDSGSGGEEAPECVGTTCGEGVPDLEEIGSMTDAFTGFWDDLQAVPIVAAAEGIAPSFGVGACPAWSETVDVYGESVEADFSFICDTWTDVSPVLTVVALVFWGVVALRILLSA